MIKNVIGFVHDILENTIMEEDIVIDATCGNGNDTRLLAELADYVYAFDIQDQAIKTTKKILLDNQFDNVKLIQDSHENIEKYVKKKVKAVTFNLGYLPGSDKQVVTTAASTIKGLKASLNLLDDDGIITIILYVGHPGGKEEAIKVESFVKELEKGKYNVVKYDYINRELSPYVIVIQKQ